LIVGIHPIPYQWVEPDGTRDRYPEESPDGHWEIGAAQPFFEWINDRPEFKAQMLALWIRDEPFWPGPWRTWCVFWSSYQMARLKETLSQALPGVPTYYDMGSAAPWENRNNGADRDCYRGRTEISDEAFDYLAIYRPPFRAGQPYDEAVVDQILAENQALKANKGLEIQFFYLGSTYAFQPSGFRMPTEDELRQFGCTLLQSATVDGLLWYPWVQYTDYLRNHPELFDDARWVAENCGR
jgi:hypothetical protein